MFAVLCGLLMLDALRTSHIAGVDGQITTGQTPSPQLLRRQNYIPVHYVTGSHYDVGFSVGRVFANMITEFVNAYEPLKDYLKAYQEPNGQKIYDESLAASREYYPQYVIEMEGMADGSGVPFHKLFLMTLDDTIMANLNTSDKGPVGCTSILVNQPTAQLLGHTEDAVSETVNNFIILAAHVIPSDREKGGIFPAREENFKAVTYAGHLAGYASGYNYHGLAFSINTIFVSKPLRSRIPREFITRALLAAKADLEEVKSIVINKGGGTADGFNVNLAFLDEPREDRLLYTIEVVPNPSEPSSQFVLNSYPMGKNVMHANRLLHAEYPETQEDGYASSVVRERRYNQLTKGNAIATAADLVKVLSNQDDIATFPIFRDADTDRVNTIVLGVFDLDAKVWTLWCNDPTRNRPLLQLPMVFADLARVVDGNAVSDNAINNGTDKK